MSRTIAQQLRYALDKSRAFGQSKHAERGKRADSRAMYKTYAYTTYKDSLDTAKSFGKWVASTHPEIRQAVELTPQVAQEYLEHKANSGARQDTLQKTASKVRSIYRACEVAFKRMPAYDLTREIRTPEARAELDALRTAKGMNNEDFNRVISQTTYCGNTWKAMVISRITGARAEGCVTLNTDDIQIQSDQLARVHLCEKGGRDRWVDVVRPQYVDALRELKSMAREGHIIYGERTGKPLKPASIEKGVKRAMEKTELSRSYQYEKMHCIRKAWAQERYNEYRREHTKLETISYINTQLGHGADRDEALLERYVATIH